MDCMREETSLTLSLAISFFLRTLSLSSSSTLRAPQLGTYLRGQRHRERHTWEVHAWLAGVRCRISSGRSSEWQRARASTHGRWQQSARGADLIRGLPTRDIVPVEDGAGAEDSFPRSRRITYGAQWVRLEQILPAWSGFALSQPPELGGEGRRSERQRHGSRCQQSGCNFKIVIEQGVILMDRICQLSCVKGAPFMTRLS